MKFRAGRFAFAIVAGLALFAGGSAQDRNDREAVAAAAGNLYVVSAKAGGVNFVSGNVTIKRVDGTSGPLVKGNFVEVGDIVSTGADGRTEILMNPGSFIRLDHNSKFYFGSTSLSDLRVFVSGGTAIFEVFASDDFKVAVDASDSRFYLTKSGVYRIDVDGSGDARLEVWKGRAQAGDTSATQIKKGRAASFDDD
ncbi:MAG: FecR domain-containing protein, partial [Acidobacteriota bacterium]|nr:FecR domain-containing protein [Acidobacteriota bacterium]